ncbi:lysozyme [Salmonella enterica subsp. enterica serovar Bredeney]|nr:lysozyme [Salmonella enterica subsp. enterica serovar Bredeney]
MMALVLGGASSLTLLNQFLHEEEGDRTHAYRDAGGVWTICKGLTHVDGNPVRKGMVLTPAQCDRLDRGQEQKALALIDRIVNEPLTPPQKAGIASFCAWNIGLEKCEHSTFLRELNAGHRLAACEQIRRWVYDHGQDCRKTKGLAHGCYGQVERRDQESALACWGIDRE